MEQSTQIFTVEHVQVRSADGSGGTLLEYRPSTLLGRFAEPGIVELAHELDEKLAALVASAAG